MHEKLSTALRRYMHSNALTQKQAAKKLGVSQAIVSRILNCGWKQKSAKIQLVAAALGVKTANDPRASEELMQALAEVWNGEPEDAQALARCIRAIGQARKGLSF